MIDKKTAFITGAARGIGHGIAMELAKAGYEIAIMDVSEKEAAAENMQKIIDTGASVLYLQGSITSEDSRQNVVDSIMKEYGRIDVLVNNAGVAPKVRMDILETTEQSYDFVMDINLKGTFFLTQKVANVMAGISQSKGLSPKIVNISSISAYTSSVHRGEYCLSKAGISMITTLFADRLAEYGINVYEIRPGIIYTDMTSTVKEKYDKLINEGLTPIKRWGFPEDIAKAVRSLVSGDFDFSTGQVVNVDGGFHLRRL